MRKDKLYAVGSLALFVWMSMTYFLFVHRPNGEAVRRRLVGLIDKDKTVSDSIDSFRIKLSDFEQRLKTASLDNSQLLETLLEAVNESRRQKDEEKSVEINDAKKRGQKSPDVVQKSSLVIAVLMFACNRVTVSKALDSLLAYRKDKKKFPIIVSQDCGHAETAQVIQNYGDQIQYIQQPDQSSILTIPKKERKFAGYFKIARHYGWA